MSKSFEELNEAERVKLVDSVLDEKIRPMLEMDGGNMEILEIKESTPYFDIYIRYLGACDGCSSGSTGTLYAIESILRDSIDEENIRVLPV
ncbi:Iron-sulfur cluster assembly scaffold protein IscU/NifU-like [hydrothermal vent metagenome]|uniref:Iron-sulfur cluster assembly scaffold protein IscU/NifU-like n=1 Tax=hydrothermal vent metagenome TaxID=652676 RepID=A0A3B1EA67_9ZZZZ